ncbi:MAG: hypothetical protein ACT4OX_15575 [Actinomycetota bacterium]
MKRLLVYAVVAVVGFFAIGAIGDATQTRVDERDDRMQTEVVIGVELKNFRQSADSAANALWASCTATVGGSLIDPGIVALGEGHYKFAMTPSLGHHGKERLLGCLNDLSIDRVKSSVVSVEDVPLASLRGAAQ